MINKSNHFYTESKITDCQSINVGSTLHKTELYSATKILNYSPQKTENDSPQKKEHYSPIIKLQQIQEISEIDLNYNASIK